MLKYLNIQSKEAELVMKMRLRDAYEERFEEAEEYNDTTRELLTEFERHYADGLVKKGFNVKFDSLKIYNRAKGSNAIISALRSNMKVKPDLENPDSSDNLDPQHDSN